MSMLYEQAYIGSLVAISGATLLVVVMWHVAYRPWLLLWFAVILSITLVRFSLGLRFRHQPFATSDAHKWCMVYFIVAGATGLCWGVAGAAFLPTESVGHQMFVLILLAGMAAGAAPLMAPVPRVFLVYALTMFLPVVLRLLVEPSFEYRAVGALSLVYLAALTILSRKLYSNLVETLDLRYENFDLIDNLSRSKEALEQRNVELNAQMAKRREAQAALMSARDELEIRVSTRTAELAAANLSLEQEITERKRIEQALFEQKERAEVTLHSIGDGVLTTDANGEINYMNSVAEALTGWNTVNAYGTKSDQVLCMINEETEETLPNPVTTALAEQRVVSVSSHSVLVTGDGENIAVEVTVAPVQDSSAATIGTVIVLHDVNQERQLKRQLAYQARHDGLTGLQNRHAFEEHLKTATASARKEGRRHALLYMDLDQFKIVNDTCGHVAGDELLRQLTVLLRDGMREGDVISRLGGDEFGVLLNDCPQKRAQQLAEEILRKIERFRFVWQKNSFDLSASIGLVSISPDTHSHSESLSAADLACYAAKQGGRNRVHVYAPDDEALLASHREMNWVSRIKRAMEDGQMLLYQQPIVSTANGREPSAHREIMLRLQDDDGRIIRPGAFVPAAERYNLMPAIDRWVISTVLQKYGNSSPREQSHRATGRVSINLSGASLADDSLLDFIKDCLMQSAVSPQRLGFEITETTAVANLSAAIRLIRELKSIGCCFSLDDFGSGVSSFAYLKSLPVDYLKIDGSFVTEISESESDFVMVEAIHRIGHVMGMATVAECVESAASLQGLRRIGVDYVQGFAIATPCLLSAEHMH
ncbi:MAG: EAL domain-containing protein [Pseudomonadota bacterium]|nr:MAG: EAL domain-containing protein [Pseudomonadota bacterium]